MKKNIDKSNFNPLDFDSCLDYYCENRINYGYSSKSINSYRNYLNSLKSLCGEKTIMLWIKNALEEASNNDSASDIITDILCSFDDYFKSEVGAQQKNQLKNKYSKLKSAYKNFAYFVCGFYRGD